MKMKLKLEKDFKPISFNLVTPAEIAKKRKLEEEKTEFFEAQERQRIEAEKKDEEQRAERVMVESIVWIVVIIAFVAIVALFS